MLRGLPVNLVTNAVNVAAELYGSRGMKVILTGGALRANSDELVGSGVLQAAAIERTVPDAAGTMTAA